MLGISLICLLFPGFSLAQKDSSIRYSDVVKVDSVSKNDLFLRARDWFNNTFRDSKEVLQIQDKESGEISGRGIFSTYVRHSTLGVQNGYEMKYHFMVTVWVKDNRYKYEITDIDNYYSGNPYGDVPTFGVLTSTDHTSTKFPLMRQSKIDALYMDCKNNVDIKINELILLLQKAMNKKSIPDF